MGPERAMRVGWTDRDPVSPELLLMRSWYLVLAALLVSAPIAAQVGSTTDILRGRVTDEANAPVVGAQVEALSQETAVRRSTVTGADGRYTLVFPDGGGRYQLRVTRIGAAPV